MAWYGWLGVLIVETWVVGYGQVSARLLRKPEWMGVVAAHALLWPALLLWWLGWQ